MNDRDKLIHLQDCIKKLASLAQADFKEAASLPPGDGDRLLAKSYARAFFENMKKADLITGFKEEGKDIWVSFDLAHMSHSSTVKASKNWRTVPAERRLSPDDEQVLAHE